MLTGMLEAVRWPPDPWALIAPNQGGGNDAVSPRVQAKRAHISTATLCAHPSRPIYVSGLALRLAHVSSSCPDSTVFYGTSSFTC